jgi:hypothetical protein
MEEFLPGEAIQGKRLHDNDFTEADITHLFSGGNGLRTFAQIRQNLETDQREFSPDLREARDKESLAQPRGLSI